MRRVRAVMFCIGVLLSASTAIADVSVAIGPTSIPRGDALGERDITVRNELFAVAFAVDTAPPWGVARGGIIDIALIRDGEFDYDIASLADFMPNNWSSWPTTYQRVTLEKTSSTEAVVKTIRDWGDVQLVTTFRIRDDDSKIHIITRMTNGGEASLDGLASGYVVWPDGGTIFGVPGLFGESSGSEENALADWSASYGENWLLGLHAPFSEILAYGGRDRYSQHNLGPGEAITFEAWLQIESDGSLAPLVEAEIAFRGSSSGRVTGGVTSSDGEPVDRPAVVVTRSGIPYAWTLGKGGDYAIDLPVGKYAIYATARGYAQGTSRTVSVSKDSNRRIDFNDVRPPGTIQIQVTDQESGEPLDARISIEQGYKPLIGFFGRDVYFTELHRIGQLTASIPPGNYELKISSGGGFASEPELIEVEVESGQVSDLTSEVLMKMRAQERGWYSADLHHHSDVLDGFTEAEFVMRSELASGVDITFLSDHDSVINNGEMQLLSESRHRPFIAGAELSPSWAHFNAYPLGEGKEIDIDTGQATVQEIFGTAREMGADVIAVNHPYSNYGYFASDENDAIPGGYDAGYDLIEIEPSTGAQRNAKTLERSWQLWNKGHRAYLAAGSDAHDVWLQESGSARTYAHVDGDISVKKFIAALKGGRSFASQGPLVFPAIMFGSELHHAAGEDLSLAYSVVAVNGLRSVRLIGQGRELDSESFVGTDKLVPIEFLVNPETDTWYSLVIEDQSGKFAYTNPVWVTITK